MNGPQRKLMTRSRNVSGYQQPTCLFQFQSRRVLSKELHSSFTALPSSPEEPLKPELKPWTDDRTVAQDTLLEGTLKGKYTSCT